jgi:hypothetical protein
MNTNYNFKRKVFMYLSLGNWQQEDGHLKKPASLIKRLNKDEQSL